MYHFSRRKYLFWVANKQTENLKITLEWKVAFGVQQKLGLLEKRTSLFIAMEFLSLRPANFSSNRNVAMGVGRGAQGGTKTPSGFWNYEQKKVVFSISRKKKQILPLLAPPGKNFGKIPYCPPWKKFFRRPWMWPFMLAVIDHPGLYSGSQPLFWEPHVAPNHLSGGPNQSFNNTSNILCNIFRSAIKQNV